MGFTDSLEERLSALQHDEEQLMERWGYRWKEKHGEYPYFNADGIVDHTRWGALPGGKHVLVILKETNALQGKLSEFLRNGGNKTYYRTWNNVARWVKMILEKEYWEYMPKEVLDDTIRNIAAINLKKYEIKKKSRICGITGQTGSGQEKKRW